MSNFDDAILRILESALTGLNTRDIANKIRQPAHRVAKALSDLQQAGLVEKKAGHKWRATHPSYRPGGARAGPSGPAERSGGAVRASSGQGRAGGDSGGFQANEKNESRAPDGRWADFRRLCRFYAECIRLEERPQVTSYAEKQGTDFLKLPSPINWRALDTGRSITLPRDAEWERFIRTKLAGNRQTALFIGYPVDVYLFKDKQTDQTKRGISPVFVMHVEAKPAASGLSLYPCYGVEINHGWLKRRFQNSDKRREFLATIGLMPTSVIDDEQEDLLAVSSFEDAARALFACFREWWQEPADPQRLRDNPPYEEIENKGLYNRAVLMAQPKLKFVARLYRELGQIADKLSDDELDQTALRFIFPHEPPPKNKSCSSIDDASEQVETSAAEFCLLNHDQRVACESALEADLAVLTGPPGTGKSVVAAHTLANQALMGRTALFASRNHQALEAVEPRLNEMTLPKLLALRPVRPYGQVGAQFEWGRQMAELLGTPSRGGVLAQRDDAVANLQILLEERASLEAQAGRLLALCAELAAAEARVQVARRKVPEFDPETANLSSCPTEPMILTCKKYAQRLSSGPRRGLAGLSWAPCHKQRVKRLIKRFRELAKDLCHISQALGLDTGRVTKPVEIAHICERWLSCLEAMDAAYERRAVESQIRALPPHETMREQRERLLGKLHEATVGGLKLVAEATGAGITGEQRQQFAQLRAAFDNRRQELTEGDTDSRLMKEFRKALRDLLEHFPLWVVSNLSVGKALPLSPGVVDLVVIDEATQCDIASIVPLLFRARRAMIIGDPKQLTHVTQIPQDTENHIRRQFGVDDFEFERFTFRVNSAFDLASGCAEAKRIQLRNHYRCHPDIAEYCNTAFYNDVLNVMTDAAEMTARIRSLGKQPGCVWTEVESRPQPASRGCYSPAEIDAVLTELKRMRESGFDGSIGVVTPFRVQADRIRDRAHQELPDAWRKACRLLVDTVDGFQGDERDVVILSLVGGEGMPDGSKLFLGKEANRFNVAVSRAKLLLHTIGDAAWAEASGVPFITELRRRCVGVPDAARVRRDDLIGPVWEPLFAEAMTRAGLPFEQQYPACGYYLDFALFNGDKKLGIEVDGEQHRDLFGERVIDDVYRDFVLEAAGWRMIRFWVYQLREDLDGCIERVRRAYDE